MIVIPDNHRKEAQVYFDTSSDNRRSQGVPLTAWLRVPLTWFQSQTLSYYPDETHTVIRRTFTPPHAPHTQRNFCGFCGTPLTYWTESPREEAEYMSITIGSLSSDDQRLLEDLNLLPCADDTEDMLEDPQVSVTSLSPLPFTLTAHSSADTSGFSKQFKGSLASGVPWFEEMIEGSRLGRLIRTRRTISIGNDRSTTVEWEIDEWREGDTGKASSDASVGVAGKRKLDQVTHT
jgi:hypothetical protein